MGEYVLLYVTVAGNPPPVLTWYHNDEGINTDPSIEVGRDGTLSIPSMEEQHVGVYRLVASNTYGSCYEEVELGIIDEDTFTIRRAESIASMIDNAPVPVASFEEYVSTHHRKSDEAFHFQFLVRWNAKAGNINKMLGIVLLLSACFFCLFFFCCFVFHAVSQLVHRYAHHCRELS